MSGDLLDQYRKVHRENLFRRLPGQMPGQYQMHWRVQPPPHFDHYLAELAIVDALIEQGGIAAWHGDGVGCVAQMIEQQAKRADTAEKRVAELEEMLRRPK